MKKVFLSVVVPCFNEEKCLNELYKRVKAVCQKNTLDSWELVLVNDGSTDATWHAMSHLFKKDKHIVAINLSRNYGHQYALSAGLEVCSGEYVLILDADLQDPPELLPKMLKIMKSGADVVYGQRISRKGETLFKKYGAFFFYRILNKLINFEIYKDVGDFRLISRAALNIFNRMPEQHRFVRGMMSWIGMQQKAILYERDPRYRGHSKYTLTKMIKFALDAVTSFSIIPLRVAYYFGLISGVFVLCLLAYIFYHYFLGHNLKGWTFLAAMILGMGSFQLIVLGLLGEYIGRIYLESKKRPLFVIREILGKRKYDVESYGLTVKR
jgi:glycosyltransferase involved in cell wall biosynthesis